MSILPRCLPAFCAMALPWTAVALDVFPPAGMAANDHVLVVPIEVQSVSAAPASITFRIHKTTYALDVYRKIPEATSWGTKFASIPAGSSTWTDSTVNAGALYEYRFHAQGVPAVTDIDGNATTNSQHVRTYLLAGVNVDRTGPRGRVVLVMPSSIQTPLAPEIARFKADLVGDGWTVHDVLTPDGLNNWAEADNGSHVQVRNDITAIYNAHPGEVKHVILLGRVPQPRSGLYVRSAPDGHGSLGAVAADCYYADINNIWTDNQTITVGYDNNDSYKVRVPWYNNAGDNRYDQSSFRGLTEAFEMGWGRIDFRGSVNGGFEIGALRNYLNKLHNYKHARNGFKPGRRSLMIDGGSLFKHIQEEFWKNITQLSGLANLDYITGASLPNVSSQPEAQYTADNGPYLYCFTAGNEPNKDSNMSRAVFWTGAKSHMAYWDYTSWMRERIQEPDSWTLSWTSIPARGRYLYHKMAMGGTIGDMMRATINNQDNETGLYGSAVRNYINGSWTAQFPNAATDDYAGYTFMGHLGDPTLRDQMIESPAWVRGRLQNAGAQVQVEWRASPDATHGYDVYSATSPAGPFTKRNGSPVHINATSGELAWTDTAPPADPVFYMIRARKLELTPSGSYFNASVGRMTEVDRSPDDFAIATATLPTAHLGSSYACQLQTSGGNPPATWTLTSGNLPAGLTMSSDGLISGTPGNAGSYPITVQAVDLQGATLSRALTLVVDMFQTWTSLPNGALDAAPATSGSFNQTTTNNWYHVAAPNGQWSYDATNKWATTNRLGREGAQPGIGYVVPNMKAATGAVAFRFAFKNMDGAGTPNRLDYRIYGINGSFSWDYWDYGSFPSGNATLLHISSATGASDWRTIETPALPVGSGYDYYVLRFMPSNVTSAEGDFMGLDDLRWSVAQPPPVFYDVTFTAGPNGSLSGNLSQSVVGGGSTTVVSALANSGYEFINWTWAGGSSTGNPLTLSNVTASLSLTANFQPFNNPPASSIFTPAHNATYRQGQAVPFSGTGADLEDGTIAAAAWTSSIDGPFTPAAGAYDGLSPGNHTITRTVTDSGGKSASSSISLVITPLAVFSQDFNSSSLLASYAGSSANLFDYIGTDTTTNNRAVLSVTDGRLRNTIACTDDGNTTQLSAARITRRTNLGVEDNFAVVSATAHLAPQNWPSVNTTYLGFTIGQNFRTGIFTPSGGTGNGPAFASLGIQARAAANTFRTTGVGGNGANFTVPPSGGVHTLELVIAANGGTTDQAFLSPTGDHTVQPGRVSVWVNGALRINNTATGVTAANLVNFSFSTGSGTAGTFAAASVFNGHYELDNIMVRTVSNLLPDVQADPFAQWAAQAGLNGPQASPGHDTLGDGMPNLLRYALGGTPATPARIISPRIKLGASLELDFQRIADPSLVYEVWASGDLVDWGTAPIWRSAGAQNTAGPVTVTDTLPMGEVVCRFLRLSVRQDTP